MGACLCRLLCGRRRAPASPYKKLDIDVEAGGATEGANSDDDEEWDDFDAVAARAGETPLQKRGAAAEELEPEPEPEPEPDPFAGFAMAPNICRTQRHAATSVWASPQQVSTSLLAADVASSTSTSWDDDLGGELGTDQRRREAEERRRARQAQRGDQPERATRTSRLAAQRVPD